VRDVLKTTAFRRLVQLLLSLAILYVLMRDIDTTGIITTLKNGSVGWLLAAIGIKTLALLTHEVRLWLALPQPRPPMRTIISLGLAAGVMNLALPARAGDLAAIAFMERECKVPPSVGTAAVGVTSFLEAALFGFFLLAVMGLGAAQWSHLVGDSSTAVVWICLSIGLGCVILWTMAMLGQKWAGKPPHSNPALSFIQRTVVETSIVLRDVKYLGVHTGAAALQVVLVVGAFSVAMLASGAHVVDPLASASFVLGISSLAAFVLPPTMAAGPAAASALVLPLFGASQTDALAYAVCYWLVAHIPATTMGLPALFARR
jgi:hypothetical protein